jgi:hypothetical protein
MKVDKIREALHAQPFRPSWIHLADGGRIPVQHEDFVAIEPAGREAIVYMADSTHEIVDVALITRLEVQGADGTTRRRKP